MRRGPEEEGPTGLLRRGGGREARTGCAVVRGSRRVNLGALQRGLLRHPVAEGVQKQRIQSGARVRLLLGLWARPGPAAGPGVSRSPCLCAVGSLRNGDSLPLGDGWA